MDSFQQTLQTNGKLFSKFLIRFWIFGQKPKFFQNNSKALILMKLQSVIYQWIRLNELTLENNEKCFFNFKLVFKIFPKTRNFQPKTENFSRKLKISTENLKIFKRIARREY